jgi:putative endonuclease
MAFMYILECDDGSYYTGSTWDLARRVDQHIYKIGANYTRKHPPTKLVYYEYFDRIDEAYKRERQLHNWSHEKKKALIEGDFKTLKKSAKKDFSKKK